MLPFIVSHVATGWPLLTHLGAAEILLPVLVLDIAFLLLQPAARPVGLLWGVLAVAAMLLTLASKLAFIGWGLGLASLDFTGISGHSVLSSLTFPLLCLAIARGAGKDCDAVAFAVGCGLAVLVGISRLQVGAHSVSEVVAGLVLGGGVSALVLNTRVAHRLQISAAVSTFVFVWLATTTIALRDLHVHQHVIHAALVISGHAKPYTREILRPLLSNSESN